jgi:hypothetical protein
MSPLMQLMAARDLFSSKSVELSMPKYKYNEFTPRRENGYHPRREKKAF